MRVIEAIKLKIDTEVDTAKFADGPAIWLAAYNTALFSDACLLSFHDDGVVWGKIKNGQLPTSDELKDAQGKPFPSPEFRPETLQECRLFSDKGELYVWRNGNDFRARLIEDSKEAPNDEKKDECFDENQVLWGRGIARKNYSKIARDDEELWQTEDFTVVSDGDEGLLHAFPTVNKLEFESFVLERNKNGEVIKRHRPLRLSVRHYLSYDDDGCAYISLSRLVMIGLE